MNWFKGEIAQAIVTSKAKQAIFVVYIYGKIQKNLSNFFLPNYYFIITGKDEKSSQISALIDKEEIAKILGSESFVAIKIEAESVPYQQFSQICILSCNLFYNTRIGIMLIFHD